MIRANDIGIRYMLEGEGAPLVLIHGVGNQLEAWDGVAARLRDRFRLLRYDLRGHGESEKVPGPYHIDDFAEDLRALIESLDFGGCHVAGFSLGGLVAQAFAMTHPNQLRKLALISTVAGRTPQEKARVVERLDMVASGIPGDYFHKSLERWFTDDFRRANPDLIETLAMRNRANDPACYAAAYRVLALTDFAERLHEIAAETLVMTGEHDIGSNPRMARLMAERIPRAVLQILPGLRHSILVEAPDTVSQILRTFFSGEPGASGSKRGR